MYGYPPPYPGYGPQGPPGPYGPMHPGFGPYGMQHPLLTVRNGAIVAASCIAALGLIELFDTLFYLGKSGFFLLRLFGWVRLLLEVGVAVGAAMMTRVPRSFGAGLAGWSAFAFLVMSLLLSLWKRLTFSYDASGGVQYGQWFILTMAYGAFTALPMIVASQANVRWGAATNAFAGVMVGIWRMSELYYLIKSTDDDSYGGGGYGYPSYYSPSTSEYVMQTLAMLPGLAALATLCFELRGIASAPQAGVPGAPMAPLAPPPGGFAPPPPHGGYGPPGPPPGPPPPPGAGGPFGPPPNPPTF